MAGTEPDDVSSPARPSTARFDPTSVDLTDFDLERIVRSAAGTTEQLGAKALELTKEATYVAVGLGVLGLQRVQVRRRELERRLR